MGSPKGKRDYAIILLACCFGIRVSDIKKLTFKNFNWYEKRLIFTQSKTKEILTLPIPDVVGWAVIASSLKLISADTLANVRIVIW